jgi:hypothetical protein
MICGQVQVFQVARLPKTEYRMTKFGMHVMSYASCIYLEILVKEMMEYDIPYELQWKEIVKLGKTKCNFPSPENDHLAINGVWGKDKGKDVEISKGSFFFELLLSIFVNRFQTEFRRFL